MSNKMEPKKKKTYKIVSLIITTITAFCTAFVSTGRIVLSFIIGLANGIIKILLYYWEKVWAKKK